MRPTPFHLALGCSVRLNNILMRICDVTHMGAQLQRRDTGQKLSESRYKLALLAREGELVFLDGLAAQLGLREARPVDWDNLDSDKRARIAFRMSYVKALIRLDVRSPNDPTFRLAVEEVARRRGDDPSPSPYTVYRWVLNYRKSGYSSDALAREFATKKGRTRRIPPEVLDLIEQKLKERSSNAGASLSGMYDEIMPEVAEELGYTGFSNSRSVAVEDTP